MISLVGSAAGTTTFTSPTHRIGDIFICFAFRDGSTTNPTIPGGWTSITNTTDGTTCSVSAGWKRATSTGETSGTWSNATRVICIVLRGCLDNGTPIGTFAPTAGTTNTVTYTSRNLNSSNITGASWFIAFAGHRSVDTTLESPPTGMTLVSSDVDANAETACFATTGTGGQTYGPATANWPSTNVSISGTASGWQTMVIEVFADGGELESRKYLTSTPNSTGANAGVLSFSERIN